MYKKLTCLVFYAVVLGLILSSTASAELVGWWKLDDEAGTVAADSSGNGNDGTVYGDAQWITGYVGGALEFDGTDDYVDLPIGPTIASLSDCTVMTWANFSNTGGAWQRLLAQTQLSICSFARVLVRVRTEYCVLQSR